MDNKRIIGGEFTPSKKSKDRIKNVYNQFFIGCNHNNNKKKKNNINKNNKNNNSNNSHKNPYKYPYHNEYTYYTIDLHKYMSIHQNVSIIKMWGQDRNKYYAEYHDMIKNNTICGIDIESDSTPPLLIQIAVGNYVYLFKPVYNYKNMIFTNRRQVIEYIKNSHTNSKDYRLVSQVDPLVQKVLYNKDITKYMFGASGDLKQLSYNINYAKSHCIIDLRYSINLPLYGLNLAKAYITYVLGHYYPSNVIIKKVTIGKLFQHVTHITAITPSMLSYAVADAWATLEIGKKFHGYVSTPPL